MHHLQMEAGMRKKVKDIGGGLCHPGCKITINQVAGSIFQDLQGIGRPSEQITYRSTGSLPTGFCIGQLFRVCRLAVSYRL